MCKYYGTLFVREDALGRTVTLLLPKQTVRLLPCIRVLRLKATPTRNLQNRQYDMCQLGQRYTVQTESI